VAAPAPVTEEFSSTHRVACVSQLQGYHFNLKELSMPIDA
jgi:hypothetical protein